MISIMKSAGTNPMRLAVWALTASNLAPVGWFVTFLPVRFFSESARNRDLVFLVPAVLAMIFAGWMESRFKRGFREGKWTDEELAPVRSMLQAAGWKWLGFAEFVLYTWAVFFARHGFTSGAFFYIFLIPLGTASRLLMAIKPSRPRGTGGLLGWKNFKPIHSEHWGEPVRHGDGTPLPS